MTHLGIAGQRPAWAQVDEDDGNVDYDDDGNEDEDDGVDYDEDKYDDDDLCPTE